MLISVMKSKIHRATLTSCNLHYAGSIKVDVELMKEANMQEYEKVQVVNIDNGIRLETYLIAGEKGSRCICLNGAAARLGQPGDKVIIISYSLMTPEELQKHKPQVVLVNSRNEITKTTEVETEISPME